MQGIAGGQLVTYFDFWSSSPAIFICFEVSHIEIMHKASGKKSLGIFSLMFSHNNNNKTDSWLPSYMCCFCTHSEVSFHQMLILQIYMYLYLQTHIKLWWFYSTDCSSKTFTSFFSFLRKWIYLGVICRNSSPLCMEVK